MTRRYSKLRHVRWPPKLFTVHKKRPGLTESITSGVNRFATILQNLNTKALTEFELLPKESGTLFRIKKKIPCYRYSDLKYKSPFESMAHCDLTRGTVVMSLGRELWPPPDKQNPDKVGMMHAIWLLLHNEQVWFIYSNDFKESNFTDYVEKIVL